MSDILTIQARRQPRLTPEDHEEMMRPVYERQSEEDWEYFLKRKEERQKFVDESKIH